MIFTVNISMTNTLKITTHAYRPSVSMTRFNYADSKIKSNYAVHNSVWHKVSSTVDLKQELEYQVAREAEPAFNLPKAEPVQPPVVTNNTSIELTGRELPLPPCVSCGHHNPSVAQKSWTDRTFASLDNFLSPMECLQLETLRGNLQEGMVGGGDGAVHDNLRRTDIAWCERNERSEWLYSRLWAAVESANTNFFGYDIQFIEPLQYSVYRAETNGFYTKHYDWGANEIGIRKLSFSVQLSDPMEYAGGDLVLYTGRGEPVVATRRQGSIIVFPSWMLHEVTPVTQGVRRSLVGWFEGPVHF